MGPLASCLASCCTSASRSAAGRTRLIRPRRRAYSLLSGSLSKRQALLSTAAQMFNERGFHATSLDDVAARLGVSNPTLYYYVRSKEQILLECVQQGLEMTLEGIEVSRRAGGSASTSSGECIT